MCYYNEKGHSIEKAVDIACVECIEKDVLREFLMKNRSEVVGMFLVDYKPSLQRKMDREEAREEGRQEGYQAGISAGENIGFTEAQTQIVKNMLARGMSDEEIIALTECTREFVEQLHENVSRD